MGNIGSTTSAVATKAQMVGFAPRDGIKEVKKEETRTKSVRELDRSETENAAARTGPDARGAKGNAPLQTPQAKVRERLISAPQREAARQTEEKPTADTPAARGRAEASTSEGPRPRFSLDTSAQIQWKFNKTLSEQTRAAENPQTQPEVQKRQFLKRMHELVKNEYQQYVKSDDALYSRRNLREIMLALHQEDPNSRRMRDDQSKRELNTRGDFDGYNKYNAMRASRSLQAVQPERQASRESGLALVA